MHHAGFNLAYINGYFYSLNEKCICFLSHFSLPCHRLSSESSRACSSALVFHTSLAALSQSVETQLLQFVTIAQWVMGVWDCAFFSWVKVTDLSMDSLWASQKHKIHYTTTLQYGCAIWTKNTDQYCVFNFYHNFETIFLYIKQEMQRVLLG